MIAITCKLSYYNEHIFLLFFSVVPVRLDGRFLSAVRTWRAKTQMNFPELLPESFCIQNMTVTPTTTTSLCSDSPHQSNSQTTSDLCVWQPVAVCSTTVLIAGSLAGAPSRREVSLLVLLTNCFVLVRCSCDLKSVGQCVICFSSCWSLSVPTLPPNSTRSGGASSGKQTV